MMQVGKEEFHELPTRTKARPLQPLRSHLDESCPGVGTERVFDCLSCEVNSPPVPTEGYRIPIREGLSYTEIRYTHFRECNPYSYIYSYNLLCVLTSGMDPCDVSRGKVSVSNTSGEAKRSPRWAVDTSSSLIERYFRLEQSVRVELRPVLRPLLVLSHGSPLIYLCTPFKAFPSYFHPILSPRLAIDIPIPPYIVLRCARLMSTHMVFLVELQHNFTHFECFFS